jgi:23S rRNA (adenine2503-C2)-methyltransferase
VPLLRRPEDPDAPVDVAGLPLQRLTRFVEQLGEPRYRARQLFQWLHRKRARSFAEMTSLSTSLRQRLAERARTAR